MMQGYVKYRTRSQLVVEWFRTGWDTYDIAMQTERGEGEIYNLLSSRTMRVSA